MYIITTGTGEHRGIGTLKKCKNKNIHHYTWQSPCPHPLFDAIGNKNIDATFGIG